MTDTPPASEGRPAPAAGDGVHFSSSLGLILAALGMSLAMFALYKTVMIAVVLFHHSNVRVPDALDRALRRAIVPPSMHRVHHSHLRVETDSNYGTVFSFWDRLFGSYRTRDRYDDIRFGIGAYEEPDWQRPLRLLTLPLRPLGQGTSQ